MATFTARQTAVSGSGVDPATATFGSVPVQGNVLIAVGMERSGGDAANATITGTGWTKEIAQTVLPADASFRRTFVVWWKLAGTSEPTAITYDDGTSNGKQLLIAEYEADAAGTFAFAGSANDNNGGTSDATVLNTGDTPSLPAGEYLMIGAASWKNQGGVPTGTTWASIALTQDRFIGGDRALAVASGRETTGGVKTSTVTWTNTGVGNRGLGAGLLAFEFSGGGPPPPPPFQAAWARNANQGVL